MNSKISSRVVRGLFRSIHNLLPSLGHGSSSTVAAGVNVAQRGVAGSESGSEGHAPPIPELKVLESFANLDHDRSARTGFPEAVFAEGKTTEQVAAILEAMAGKVNERQAASLREKKGAGIILATRVHNDMFRELSSYSFTQGSISYHSEARIVTMKASSAVARQPRPEAAPTKPTPLVVVATAGTTDLPVAEEAAVTLEAAGCRVDRVYDAGVAGLHRIVRALPRLRHPDVGAVIVCAGMDGALPSVVGGLVSVPVIAVPTSIGYGASFSGVAALLTMLNTCSPGVGVVNIDNGFGAAALVYKCLEPRVSSDDI